MGPTFWMRAWQVTAGNAISMALRGSTSVRQSVGLRGTLLFSGSLPTTTIHLSAKPTTAILTIISTFGLAWYRNILGRCSPWTKCFIILRPDFSLCFVRSGGRTTGVGALPSYDIPTYALRLPWCNAFGPVSAIGDSSYLHLELPHQEFPWQRGDSRDAPC